MLQLELVSKGLAGLSIPYNLRRWSTTQGKPQASSQDPVEISSCQAVNQCFATEFPSGCEDHQILVLPRFPWMLIVRGFCPCSWFLPILITASGKHFLRAQALQDFAGPVQIHEVGASLRNLCSQPPD